MNNGVQEGNGLMINFQSLCDPLLEELFVIGSQYIYDLMCVLHAYRKRKYKSTGTTDFNGGRPLLEY